MLAPPCSLVTVAVNFAMMSTAEGHGELVADFEAQGSRLGKAHVVRIGRLPAADQAGL